MSTVGQKEIATQQQVIKLFTKELGYSYLGHWKDRLGNSNVEEGLIARWLKRRGHSDKVIGLRTLDVPSPKVEQEELERIKTHILKQKGLKVETSRTIYLNSQSVDRYPALGRIL